MRTRNLLRRYREWRRERRARWEGLCTRCGLCCYERTLHGTRLVIHYDRPCRFLDTKHNLCTVYDRRFELCGQCRRVTVLHALFDPGMPPQCGYVKRYRFWKRWRRPRR